MKKLLNIPREEGYPLCAETLELLHDNVQLLETVLNGLKLPQHTIVRFPYGDFAYVQSVNPTSGTGEILKILYGASLPNANVQGYQIISLNNDVTNVNDVVYSDVYQDRSLTLTSSGPIGINVRVYDFEDIFQFGMFDTKAIYRVYDEHDAQLNCIEEEITPYAKYNEDEIRICAIYSAHELPITSESEIRLVFNGTPNNISMRVIPVLVSFNSLNGNINKSVNANICGHGNGVNRFQLKIFTHELYGIINTFSGKITVSAIAAL